MSQNNLLCFSKVMKNASFKEKYSILFFSLFKTYLTVTFYSCIMICKFLLRHCTMWLLYLNI